MALALAVLRMDKFCGVMSTAAARSFSRILRCARTTSRLTMMGINFNRQFLFPFQLLCFPEQPCHKKDHQARDNSIAGNIDVCWREKISFDGSQNDLNDSQNNIPPACNFQMPDGFRIKQEAIFKPVKKSEEVQRDHKAKRQAGQRAAILKSDL